jgi:hypothetical protein
MTTEIERRVSGFAPAAKAFEIQQIAESRVAESWARQSAMRSVVEDTDAAVFDGLGPPLSIRAVARMLGCSPWTVRQQHIPAGLPHFRSGPQGKIVFFRDQVVQWVLRQQQRKGGNRP